MINEGSRKPVDDPALKALRERAVTRLESGALLVTRDDKELPVEHSGAPILGFDGSLAGSVLIFRDVTERRRTAQRQSMLVGELNHRVKNALAIVQSLVQASLGLQFDPAAREIRFEHPMLPAFLDHLHVRGLRLGDAEADVLLHRSGEEVAATVTRRCGEGRIVIVH